MHSRRVVLTRAPRLEPVAATTMPRIPESAAEARHLVAGTLISWQLPDLRPAAELILTELVSNAVKHADGDAIRVTVILVAERRVRVEVLDLDRTRPQTREQSDDAESGRGLLIIDAIAAAWGVDLLPRGKRVWAEVDSSDEAS